ncbi:MAG: hypothetical protein OXC25_04390, partial [Thiotrichales bacterium]|nr:hypothetical protein [Thiotrichales bacterium]
MGARIVIMNPPFTNRTKMGEKFPDEVQNALRQRVDALESGLIRNDPELEGVASKTAIAPLFEMLADRVADTANGVVAMIRPTIVCSGPSNEQIRRVLAKRFHIHTLLTCHCPGNVNLSQNTAINESLIVMQRHGGGETPATRIVALDRFPGDEAAMSELYEALHRTESGRLPEGWGEVSRWPAKWTEAGDWTAGVFRAPALAEAAYEIAHSSTLIPMEEQEMVPSAVLMGGQIAQYKRHVQPDALGAFPVFYSKSADVQRKIRGAPDEHWAPRREVRREQWVDLPDADDSLHPDTARVMRHAAHLLVTAGQDTGTGRLTSVVRDEPSLGLGWLPVPGIMLEQARAASVFLNSTAGRLQLMRNPGMKLAFPQYNPAGLKTIRLPDLSDKGTVERLTRYWETTADEEVPQYRDGECEARRIWDDAVSDTLGWDKEWLAELRQWLHREPHVRGLGY